MFLKQGLRYVLASAILFNSNLQAQVKPIDLDQKLESVLAPDRIEGNYAWVQNGAINPQEYLISQAQEVPEVKNLQEAGILSGILYNPSMDTIKDCIRKSIGKHISDPRTIDYMVSAEEFRLNNLPPRSIATVVPCRFDLIGAGVPGTIIVFKTLLDKESFVRNDVDARMALVHEANHVLDHYQGFDFGGKRVIGANFVSQGFSQEFIYAAIELNAYGSSVSFAKVMTLKGESLPSGPYTSSNIAQAKNYAAELKRTAKSPAEIQARDHLLRVWNLK